MKKTVLLGALLLATVAHADDVAVLKQQVQTLQQSVRSMQQAGIEKGIQSAEGSANIERVRREFQSLQGSFDAIQFKLQNIQDSLNRYQQDTNARLKTIEEKVGAKAELTPGAITPALPITTATVTSVTTASIDSSDAILYQKGLSQVRDGNFVQAATTFRDLLQKFPKSAVAGNSQYWLAECYYAQKDYAHAIKEYQTTITNYPKLDKIPAAKLKQGLAFADLGKPTEATLFLQNLVKEYPGTAEAHRAQDKLKFITQANTRMTNDSIPMAPGAIPPKVNNAADPQNQPSVADRDRL